MMIGASVTLSRKKTGYRRSFFLAGDEGFEPPNVGTKSRCLTTWRIPSSTQYGTDCTLIRVLPQVAYAFLGSTVFGVTTFFWSKYV